MEELSRKREADAKYVRQKRTLREFDEGIESPPHFIVVMALPR